MPTLAYTDILAAPSATFHRFQNRQLTANSLTAMVLSTARIEKVLLNAFDSWLKVSPDAEQTASDELS